MLCQALQMGGRLDPQQAIADTQAALLRALHTVDQANQLVARGHPIPPAIAQAVSSAQGKVAVVACRHGVPVEPALAFPGCLVPAVLDTLMLMFLPAAAKGACRRGGALAEAATGRDISKDRPSTAGNPRQLVKASASSRGTPCL